MSDVSRLQQLVYQLRDLITTGKVTKKALNDAVAPDNIIVGNGVKKITVSTTPPANPEPGELWIDIS
jgi:hypothetical protein